jgi:ComF family protein
MLIHLNYYLIVSAMNQWFESFAELFYPHLCITCTRKLFAEEKYVCMFCWTELPRTHFHLDPGNKMAQLFWGRVRIESATAWFYFRKGSHYQQLIHHLKYKGLKELGFTMGNKLGHEISTSPFSGTDLVIPIPLHRKKEKIRGYNQSSWIAMGIASALNIPFSEEILKRSGYTETQTRKNRFERWQNVEGIFEVVKNEEVSGKHILLVDDVVTTGSTLEAAAGTLLSAGASKVSLAALAIADY